MRLSNFEIQTIQTLAKKHFGLLSRVFLFGSRVNDTLKGGDIDLFVSSEGEGNLTLEKKISFLVDLKRCIGYQKIDVVLDSPSIRSRESFYQSIVTNYIELTNFEHHYDTV